jgi:hypothetical protein
MEERGDDGQTEAGAPAMLVPPHLGRGSPGRSTVSEGVPLLPEFGYRLDESDPDLLVLRREDGSFVAAFSARGATREGILEAVREDHRAPLREHAVALGPEDRARRRSA